MKKGFTLIELMVVVAIIATLAAIGLPNFIYARRRSLLAACESNMRSCAEAVSMYNVDTKCFPADLSVLITDGYLQNEAGIQCPLNAPTQYHFRIYQPGDTEYDTLSRLYEIECLNTEDGGGPIKHVGRSGPRSNLRILKYIWGVGIFSLEE